MEAWECVISLFDMGVSTGWKTIAAPIVLTVSLIAFATWIVLLAASLLKYLKRRLKNYVWASSIKKRKKENDH